MKLIAQIRNLMTKWEYKTVGYKLGLTDFEDIDSLNTCEGTQGWEIYSVSYNYPSISFFMKREVKSDQVLVE